MKMKITAFAGLVLATGFTMSLQAADSLILTSEKAANATAIGLDFSSSGQATALEFRIAVGDGAKVNLAGCAKGLPSTHSGTCALANGHVIGLVYSDSNALLPAGILTLGSIGVSSKAKPALTLLVVSDAQGNKLNSSVDLGGDAVDNKNVVR